MQITIVSIKVPVMLTKPCLTGSRSPEAPDAIAVEPSPASLVNTPLPIPIRIAIFRDIPAAAPRTALGEKALRNIRRIADGILSAQQTSRITEQITYAADISGTSISQTFEIRLTPPSRTAAEAPATIAPLSTIAQE